MKLRFPKDDADRFLIIAVAVVMLFLLLLCAGCKPQYIPVESIKTEYRDRYIHDSIFEKEYINTYQKGDTVFKDRFVYVYKDKLMKDTVNITDTIRVPYPVSEYIEVNKQAWYQSILQWIGLFALFFIVGFISYKIKRK